MLATYPALRQTWQTAAIWGEIDALRESCEAIQRMLDD
jgi:hypothetical protein